MTGGDPLGLHLCGDGSVVEDPSECRGRGGIRASLPGGLRVALSKKMAGLLRHYPHRYGLALDPGGWARVSDLVEALRRMGLRWVEEWHVRGVALHDPKGRYELREGLVRARYGHSVRVALEYPEDLEVKLLYHGTPARNLASIMRSGLLPGKRLYVHLAAAPDDALETGRRHGTPVALLRVDAECLRRRSIRVYRATGKVYLVEWVPPECLKLERITG